MPVGLLPFYDLSSCNGPSPGISETVLGDTANLLAMARMDVPPWTTCATRMGCSYRLMLSVVTRALAKCKTREKSVRRNISVETHLWKLMLYWFKPHFMKYRVLLWIKPETACSYIFKFSWIHPAVFWYRSCR